MLKKGDLVVMHTCGEADFYEGVVWACQSDEFTAYYGRRRLVMLDGGMGQFAAEYLRKIDKVAEEMIVCEGCNGLVLKDSNGYETDAESDVSLCRACIKQEEERMKAEDYVTTALKELNPIDPLCLIINTKNNPFMLKEIIEVMKKYDKWGE